MSFEGLVCIGLQPGLATKARLEGGHDFIFIQTHLLTHQPSRLMTEAVVGIAIMQVALGACHGRKTSACRAYHVHQYALNTARTGHRYKPASADSYQ